MKLQDRFESWARRSKTGAAKPWLLSKWEVQEGVDWPRDKIVLMLKSIRAGLQLKKSHSLADLGCGGGWILKGLRPYVRSTVGVDFSLSMLRWAKQAWPQAALVGGNINRLPFADETFDRALSYFVFINTESDALVQANIRDIVRVLKKNGVALLGQLPDRERSREYDRAKKSYLEYCASHYHLGRNFRRICPIPQKLYDRAWLSKFLGQQRIRHELRDSFNPFYRRGEPSSVKWRFDVILRKG